ncbi:MAG: CPBP family intramembrane metalloprotease [Oscillospiraceae bacterium]|nr:CPBP family intramembrane metalloprotease [Oscillospiraceae bacterium]
MKTKVIVQFTLLTLGITLLTWGGLVMFAQFGIATDNHPWLFALIMLGGLSPTYVSYLVLKRNGEVSGFKEWLKNVFYVRAKMNRYLFVTLFIVLFMGTNIAVSGMTGGGQPLHLLPVGLAMSFVAGGLEEAGWRYILQPGLDQKIGFVLSSLVTGVIWWAWHIPLFFIGFLAFDFWMYAVMVMGMTFFYGAIIRISGRAGVFLSVLAHTLTNVALGGLPFYETWAGTITAFVVMVSVSAITVFVYERRKKHLAMSMPK